MKNFSYSKIPLNRSNTLKLLFYIFPIMMLCSSGYITVYVTVLTFFSLYYFLYNKIKIKITILDYLIIIFFLSSITSTLINFEEIGAFMFLKSFLDIRFALFFFITRLIFQNLIINIKIFSLITFLCTAFLSLNIFAQHLIGYDIFGHPPFDGRYNGLFESEAIAGSYIQKFYLISIFFIFLSKNNEKAKPLFILIIIVFLGLGVLMSLDRMPFLIYLFITAILTLIFKGSRITFACGLFLLLLIFKILINNYPVIKIRYAHIIGKFEMLKTNQLNYNFDIRQGNINNYLGLYRTSYEIFLKKPFFGSGIKSFGTQCNKLNFKDKELLCLTHPHNIYLEIIINQGIVGLLIFLTFIFLLVKSFFFNFYFKKNNKEHVFNIFFFTILIAELIPIRSYGSIFQTVNGSFFWFLLALASVKSYIKKN